MSKLIYSLTSTKLEETYSTIKNADLSVNSVYRSIAFTGDGYLYTHGKKFRLFEVFDNSVNGLSFQITNGTASVTIDGISLGTGTVVQSVTGDSIISATTNNGVVTLAHSTPLSLNTSWTFGDSEKIPIITVDLYGHITSISNSNSIDATKVKGNVVSVNGSYYPIGVTDGTKLNPIYSVNFYFDLDGNLHANNFFVGANNISTIYAPLSHTNVLATDSVYGHVILIDTYNTAIGLDNHIANVNDHIAVTPYAVKSALDAANQYSQDLFAAQDAMVFVGTINASGVITSHNDDVLVSATDNTTTLSDIDYKVGWTFRFTLDGTFNGEDVEAGDMIIAIHAKGNDFSMNDWTIIQTNINGALTANSNLNGILFANNSRVVQSLNFADGVLISNGTTVSFVNKNTLWRDIKANSTSIETNDLNLLNGNYITITKADNSGDITIAANASDIIATSAVLTLTLGTAPNLVSFSYSPSTAKTLAIGSGLTLSVDNESNYTLGHAFGTTFTSVLGSITTDNFGHVTNIVPVTALKNPNALSIKNGASEILSYDGDTAKVLKFSSNDDFSFNATTENGEIVLTPSTKHREIKYFETLNTTNAVTLLSNDINTALTLVAGKNIILRTTNDLENSMPRGYLRIDSINTWRDVSAYTYANSFLTSGSLGANPLNFSDDFIILILNNSSSLGLMWTEIASDGTVTYTT